MAGEGYRAMGQAQRGIAKNRRNVDKWRSNLADITSAATFMVGQADKSKTAWEEYEKGYKAIGGTEPIDKGGWLKSKFGMPKGEVGIGKGRKYKAYDMEEVRKAGSFLGSDAGAILDEDARTKFLEQTAPGVEKTRHHDPTKSYPTSYQQMRTDSSTIDSGTGTDFVPTGIAPKHERMMRVRGAPSTAESFQQQPSAFEQGSKSKRFAQSMNQPINISELATQMPSIPEEVTGGVQGRWQQRMRVSENIPEFTTQQPLDTSFEFGEGGSAWDTDIQNMDWANMSKGQRTQATIKAHKKKKGRSVWDSLQLNNKNRRQY